MSKNEAYIAVAVATAIVDLFKDEEERSPIPKIDTENLKEEGNDLFFALFKAIQIVFNNYTGEEHDSLDFLAILTRLAVVKTLEEAGVKVDVKEDKDENDGSDECSALRPVLEGISEKGRQAQSAENL